MGPFLDPFLPDTLVCMGQKWGPKMGQKWVNFGVRPLDLDPCHDPGSMDPGILDPDHPGSRGPDPFWDPFLDPFLAYFGSHLGVRSR